MDNLYNDILRVIYDMLDESTRLVLVFVSKRMHGLFNPSTLSSKAAINIAARDDNVNLLEYFLSFTDTKAYGFFSKFVAPGILAGNSQNVYKWYKKRGLGISRYVVIDNIKDAHIEMLDELGTIYDDKIMECVLFHDRDDIFRTKYSKCSATETIKRIIGFDAVKCLKCIHIKHMTPEICIYGFQAGNETTVKMLIYIYRKFDYPKVNIAKYLVENYKIQFPSSLTVYLNTRDFSRAICIKSLESVKHIVKSVENIVNYIPDILDCFKSSDDGKHENIEYVMSLVSEKFDYRGENHHKYSNSYTKIWIKTILPKLTQPQLSGFRPCFSPSPYPYSTVQFHQQFIIKILAKLVSLRPLELADIRSLASGYTFPNMYRFLIQHIVIPEDHFDIITEHCLSKKETIKVLRSQFLTRKLPAGKRVKY